MSEKKNSRFLSVENLVVEYTSDGQVVHAVNGVSFHLDRGRTLGLVGETGAGKTTIAKAIMRILQEPPAAIKDGSVLLDGTDLLKLHKEEMYGIRGAKISMIFQDPMTSLNPVHKVGEQIAEVIQIHNSMTKKEARGKAIEMLERVGIPADRYDEYPHQFSGGMKQRVVIAMALACNPELLLADEPTSALDVTIQAEVLTMIKKLREEFNTAMIMITHDLGVVADVCDKVCVIYAGRIIESGSKEDIFDHPTNPYTQGLFAALPDLKKDVDRLSPIEGLPPDPSSARKGCDFAERCPHKCHRCDQFDNEMREVAPGHYSRCWKTGRSGD